MTSAGDSGQRAASAARQAADSKWIERAARVGLAARGLVYVLIGILALQIAFVDRAERADQKGAFQTLAQNGFGRLVLWLVILGFLGYGLWQATEAAWGHRRELDDRQPGRVGRQGGDLPGAGGGHLPGGHRQQPRRPG